MAALSQTVLSLLSPLKKHFSQMELPPIDTMKGEGQLSLTHYSELDRLNGRPQPGSLYAIASRPGMGKTCFVMNVLLRAAAAGTRTLYVSADMHIQFFLLRLLGMHADVSLNSIRQDRLSTDESAALKAGIDSLMKLPIVILDAYKMLPWKDLLGQIERLLGEQAIRFVIFDSLDCFRTSSPTRKIHSANPVKATRELLCLCQKTDSVGLVVQGMNRAVELRRERMPKVTDIRGGKRLIAMFESLLFVERPDLLDRIHYLSPDREYEDFSVHHFKMNKQQIPDLVLLRFCKDTLRILGDSA